MTAAAAIGCSAVIRRDDEQRGLDKSPFFQSLPAKYKDNPDNYCILESRGRDRKEIQKEMVAI